MQILKLLKLDFLNWKFILKKFCFNRMSYICEYVRKPFEKVKKWKLHVDSPPYYVTVSQKTMVVNVADDLPKTIKHAKLLKLLQSMLMDNKDRLIL